MRSTAAIERCFRKRYPALVQFLHGLLGDRGAAEDAAQEAFRRLLDRGPRTRPDADRWVFRVARRVALDMLKVERRRHRRESRWRPTNDADPFPADDVERIRQTVALLRPREREVLLLQAVNGMSLAEIAEVVGRTAGAVKQDLHRARQALRRAWFAQENAT